MVKSLTYFFSFLKELLKRLRTEEIRYKEADISRIKVAVYKPATNADILNNVKSIYFLL